MAIVEYAMPLWGSNTLMPTSAPEAGKDVLVLVTMPAIVTIAPGT